MDPGNDTASRQYSFSSRWHLTAPQEEVWGVFEELLTAEDPFVWWPGMDAARRGSEDIHVSAGSPFGYTLRFRLHDLVPTPMEQVTLKSDGDLAGTAAMRLTSVDDAHSAIDVSWHVDVTPRWMRMARFALRPVFVMAHDSVMRAGERGLNEWLRPSGVTAARRRRSR